MRKKTETKRPGVGRRGAGGLNETQRARARKKLAGQGFARARSKDKRMFRDGKGVERRQRRRRTEEEKKRKKRKGARRPARPFPFAILHYRFWSNMLAGLPCPFSAQRFSRRRSIEVLF